MRLFQEKPTIFRGRRQHSGGNVTFSGREGAPMDSRPPLLYALCPETERRKAAQMAQLCQSVLRGLVREDLRRG
jgi:hypothetical protein